MADPTIDEILTEFADHINGIPPVRLQRRTLVDAVRDVCYRTWAWQEEIGPLAVKSGIKEYEIIPTFKYTRPIGIVWLKYKNAELALDQYELEGNVVTLSFTPQTDIDEGLTLKVALEPDKSNNLGTIDESFYELTRDAIRNIFLFKLKTMPARPWSAPQEASMYWNLYLADIRRIRSQIRRRGRKVEERMYLKGQYVI
ncbi:MAG: hypothetical protein DRH04_06125 [Deltaproteobacteria bacterium]|nr:MAG: hypothetical protein DRH04_06125 [Deltaproteobacteria bacterium]